MRRRAAGLILCLACGLASIATAQTYAIGDIHGDEVSFLKLLEAIGLTDAEGNWTGGEAVLIQTGDYTDRGPGVRGVMQALQKLEQQASAAGGDVVVLLGNHEAMNLFRIYRDVSERAYRAYVDSDSDRRVKDAWRDYSQWRKRRNKHLKSLGLKPTLSSADQWRARHPPGALEYREAFEPDQPRGRWLRGLDYIARRDRVEYLHASIHPVYADLSTDELNRRLRSELENFDECRRWMIEEEIVHFTSDFGEMLREATAEAQGTSADDPQRKMRLQSCVDLESWLSMSSDGPLWFRGFARWSEEEGQVEIAKLLEARDVDRFVVGHTPQRTGRIRTRFDDSVVLIDTGMLQSVYRGRANALLLDGEELRALGISGEVPIDRGEIKEKDASETEEASWRGPDLKPLPYPNAELVQLLMTLPAEDDGRTDHGVNRPFRLSLQRDGGDLRAVFRTVEHVTERKRLKDGRLVAEFVDSYRYEPAAYRLSEHLGVGRVPPAVTRRYRGDYGSVQLWVEGAMVEKEFLESGAEPRSPVAWAHQRIENKVFDALIQNVDRNAGNLLIDRETDRMFLIDHTRAFVRDSTIPQLDEVTQCPEGFYQALRSTTEAQLTKLLEDVLQPGELKALWRRWEVLVQHFAALIEEKGEGRVLF